VTFKYPARVLVFVLLTASCFGSAAPSRSPAGPTEARPSLEGLASAPHAIFGPLRLWYVLPDPGFREDARITVTFPDADPTAGRPRARLRSTGRAVDLVRSREVPAAWQADLPLDGAPPGAQQVEILVGLRAGGDAVVASRVFTLSAPEYVVWTLDFEGDDAGDDRMANTAAIADRFGIPMTLMWNPRVWTTAAVSAARAEAMLTWTKGRAAAGDEIALHIHMWTDFVRAAGVTPLTDPSWASRGDGYDVPLTAYAEDDTRKMLDLSLRLMAEHGLPRPTTFRGGGQFANAANLRALAAAGFVADCSAVPAGSFGRLSYPWTLARDAQPYRPSPDDANTPGSLRLLEAPTIGGNTFGHDARSIVAIARADLSYLAPAGEVATERRAITLVSHPSTVGTTERAAIETLLTAFEPLRYDRDAGPLRFVTLAQLAKAYGL
jgi:hypothetical protein